MRNKVDGNEKSDVILSFRIIFHSEKNFLANFLGSVTEYLLMGGKYFASGPQFN